MNFYDKVKVVVFTTQHELHMYYKLLLLMCGEDVVESKMQQTFCTIETEKLKLRFYVKPDNYNNARGIKAHYVLNLTQDEEFDRLIARPMTIIRDLLDKDKFGLS